MKFKQLRKYYDWGAAYLRDPLNKSGIEINKNELDKQPYRYNVINFLLELIDATTYLEIGVRNPEDNYNKIICKEKYSVDPGLEFKLNPVDFKVTSDQFFLGLNEGRFLSKDVRFDLIFIDGLHTANQVERDIENALKFVSENGFIVLHDCNPPTEWHARENHKYRFSPAQNCWNGTTWKAFVKYRKRNDVSSCCIDTDWGVGVISKNKNLGKSNCIENEFYEFEILKNNRSEILNLVTFEEFKGFVEN